MKPQGDKDYSNEVIILNKPFLGGWLDAEGHIAHEIIDFLRDDNGEHYIYGLHAGTCPDNIWVGEMDDLQRPAKSNQNPPLIRAAERPLERIEKEKCVAKYLVLTSHSKMTKKNANEDKMYAFDILYVVKLKEKLHRLTTRNKQMRDNGALTGELIKRLNIQYNGKPLDQCFDNRWDIAVTYRADEIFEAKCPIHVKMNYQWRNKGYIWNKQRGKRSNVVDNPAYKNLKQQIERSIKNGNLEKFIPNQVNEQYFNEEKFKGMPGKNSLFLEVISLQDYEQAFTNMLYSVLRVANGSMLKQFCTYMRDEKSLPNSDRVFNINQWTKIKVYKECPSWEKNEEDEDKSEDDDATKGRMDVCADIYADDGETTLIQRIIIENKIDSGLNGVDEGKKISQLNTYYKWGQGIGTSEHPRRKKPLCFVVAPDYRIQDLENEIKEKDKKKSQKDSMSRKYHLLSYGQIAGFIEKNQKELEKEINPVYVKEFIQSFRAHSLNKKDDYAWRFYQSTCNRSHLIPTPCGESSPEGRPLDNRTKGQQVAPLMPLARGAT